MDYQQLITDIAQEIEVYKGTGEQADYIPELAKIGADKFGVSLNFLNGDTYTYGDADEDFSIQSISKVFTTAVAFAFRGNKLWDRVGVEPSGSPFNSLVQLEYESGKPRNPFINSGALVIADVLITELENPYDDMLDFIREISGVSDISYNKAVAQSEIETGYRNGAMVYMLKSFDNLENETLDVLKYYCYLCSIEMTCRELAQAFQLFAQRNNQLKCNIPNLTNSQLKRLNALMQTCGFYDESGEFSFKVGLPGKSGVGGGIAAVCPNSYSIAVWSPRLNAKGNSILGMKFLELLTSKSGMSIF